MSTASAPLAGGRTPRVYLVLLATLVCLAGTVVVLFAHDFGSSTGRKGSGTAATETRALPPFTAIELAGTNEVTVHVGGKQSVVVHADDNLIDLVTTDVTEGKLVVGNRQSFTTNAPMSVNVTVPALTGASLTGAGVVKARGTVGPLYANLAGVGDLQLQDLVARVVTARISGSGRVQVHATSSLAASVSGAGTILYSGNPDRVTTNITGAGAITKQE